MSLWRCRELVARPCRVSFLLALMGATPEAMSIIAPENADMVNAADRTRMIGAGWAMIQK
jgi:hypothetical protein